MDFLENQGLDVLKYEAGNESDRLEKVRQLADERGDVRFSVGEEDEPLGNDEGTRFREEDELAEANERYNADLNDFIEGKGLQPIHLGRPSPALRASGLNGTEMYIRRKTLRDHLNKHGLTVDDIRDLPLALENPLLVYEWGAKAKSLVVITEIPHGDDRITVAVKLERNGKVVEVNEIASVHAKEANRFLSEMINAKGGGIEEALQWVGDKQKALDWLGLVPSSPKEVGALSKEELSVAKVIEDFENPKLSGEKNEGNNEAPDVQFSIDDTASNIGRNLGIDIGTTDEGRREQDRYTLDPETGKIIRQT